MEWPWMKQCLRLLCVIILVQVSGTKGCFQEEKTALLGFKEFAVAVEFAKLSNDSKDPPLPSWVDDPKSDCCGWERVLCDSSGHITDLSLDAIYHRDSEEECQYDNPIPVVVDFSMFLPLKELRSLNLSSNCFLPSQAEDYRSNSTLKKLETLDLSYNNYDLIDMEYLGGFSSLKHLSLANNNMDFSIQALSALQHLELLDLSYTGFSCNTPEDELKVLSTLKKLRTLNLAGNCIDAHIFKYLVTLPALKSLFLQDQYRFNNVPLDPRNFLDDEVLTKLSNLEVLYLRSFGLMGPLPIQGLCGMKKLQELDLSRNDFTGALHACFSNLTSLRALDLSHNLLNGSIPYSFTSPLDSLEVLSLSYNKFIGLFPLASLANHSKLKVLTLGGFYNEKLQVETENPPWVPSFQLEFLQIVNCEVNLRTRTIPSFLSYQYALKLVDLSHNNLVGMFPYWLLGNNPRLESVVLNHNTFNGSFQLPSNQNQQIDHLRHLKMSHNMFQGKLPESIGLLLPNLEYLDVSNNNFDGSIPASIGLMSNLKALNLAYNNLSGKIPKKVLLGCISLNILRLTSNRLEGQIFPKPLNLGSLRVLMMDNNNFNGTLQDGLLVMEILEGINLSNNNLSGKLPQWIGNFSSLFHLSLAWNMFEGAIPVEVCKLYNLRLMQLSYNRFSSVPDCEISTLNFLHLQGNGLNGNISKALFGGFSAFDRMVTVDLRDNKFVGGIPTKSNDSLSPFFLLLGGNELQGEFTPIICQLRDLHFLDLSRNNFTGSIPACLKNISFAKTVNMVPGRQGRRIYDNDSYLDDLITISIFETTSFNNEYQYHHFDLGLSDDDHSQEEVELATKVVPLSYKGDILMFMSGLDLSSNQLTGDIPEEIGYLSGLHAMNLSHNHLSGSIPESFHNLKDIESLDLSYNNLSGRIPIELQDLNSLSFFNVSYNNLSGRAPSQGQFGSFDESSYIGNPHLFVNNSNRGRPPPLPQQLPTPFNNQEEEESAIDPIAFCWCFGASYVTILLMFVIVLWINPYWRRRWFYFIETCLYKCLGRFLGDAFY